MESLTSLGTFGVCVDQGLRERRLQKKPTSTIGEILAAAGLTIREESKTGKTATKLFKQQTVSEIRELLARCGLTIHD